MTRHALRPTRSNETVGCAKCGKTLYARFGCSGTCGRYLCGCGDESERDRWRCPDCIKFGRFKPTRTHDMEGKPIPIIPCLQGAEHKWSSGPWKLCHCK